MSLELKKRIITSIFLITGIILMFLNKYVMLYVLLVASILSVLEFIPIIIKIFNRSKYKVFLTNSLFVIYISIFTIYFFIGSLVIHLKIFILLLLIICIASDIGGYIFGKIFKGPKLTKISPNKTIYGSVGSFLLSIFATIIFVKFLTINIGFYEIIILSLSTSLGCQIGDIFFSFLKRKADIKDTGNILPGHGGILDRVDGILLGLPFGILIPSLLLLT
tara:strand:- start:83 stop:742 length:660 start_codon:yes stop_codon:yes gene_type:complete